MNVKITPPPAFVVKPLAPGRYAVVAKGFVFNNTGDGAPGGPVAWDDVEDKPTTFPPASHTHATGEVTGLDAALAAKAAASHTHAISEVVNLATTLSAKADLVDGVIPTSQIPAQAVSDFLGDVASEAAMLALTGQRGDWCIRTDVNRTYFLINEPAATLANWRYIETPASPVVSVNGQTGVIVFGKGDIGLGSADNTSDANKVIGTNQPTAITGLLYGNGSNLAAVSPSNVQAAAKNALSNAARLALSGGSLTDWLIVYDTDWLCDFRYNLSGGYWQQLNRPRHTISQANALPNPVIGYRVWLTDLNVEGVWQGFWAYTITLYKPTTTTRQNNTLAADPHLQTTLQAGSWLIEAFIVSNNPSGGNGWRHQFTLPNMLAGESWGTGGFSRIGTFTHGITNLVITINTTTTTSTLGTGNDTSGVMSARFVWRCDAAGTFSYNWSQNTTGAVDHSILAGSFIRLTKTA